MNEIRELLARRRVDPAPDAGTFWSDFKARARLMNQEQPEMAPVFFSPGKWAIAAACAVLMAVTGGLFLFRQAMVPETEGEMTLDVKVAHSAILIIKDEPSHGTIVWITDMRTDDDDGDSV